MGVLQKNKLLEKRDELEELAKYGLLDAASDKSLDGFTVLAAILLDVPLAGISIVDSSNIWFVSRYGIEQESISKKDGLCASGLHKDSCYFVEDTLQSECMRNNRMVTGAMRLRFYAGVPLISKAGKRLGSLCVMDRVPRKFSKEHQRLLELVAQLLMKALEEKHEYYCEIENRNQLVQTTVHDLKNPLSVMPLLARMIQENKHDPEMVQQLSEKIFEASMRMSKFIEEFLDSAKQEKVSLVKLNMQSVDLSSLSKSVIKDNQLLAYEKGQVIIFKHPKPCRVCGDPDKLREIIENLLNNAIKFSPSGKRIWISIGIRDDKAVLEVTDEGAGLSPNDINNLYRPFTTLSAKPTGGEHSSGLGLSIVKNLVDAHQGRITAKSNGQGKGSSFRVELPLWDSI